MDASDTYSLERIHPTSRLNQEHGDLAGERREHDAADSIVYIQGGSSGLFLPRRHNGESHVRARHEFTDFPAGLRS